MLLISEPYRKLNEQLHKTRNFGGSGHRWIDDVCKGIRLVGVDKIKSIMDYGCGQSTFWRNFKTRYPIIAEGMYYREYDPCIIGKNEMPRKPCDLVVCTDVLEHVEPEFINNVIKHIFSLARVAIFWNIAMIPANKVLPDGTNAHLIVQPKHWWVGKLFENSEDWIGFMILQRTRRPEKDLNIWMSRQE